MHRDLKLNNLAFCINTGVDSTAAGLEGCSGDARLSARILDVGEAVQHRSGDRGPTSYGRCRSEYASIARHNGEEQGFKDDIEMLLYAFLDKLMTGGLPWKQQSEGSQRLGRIEMRRMKVDFRQVRGQQSEMRLVNMLSTLDSTPARVDPSLPRPGGGTERCVEGRVERASIVKGRQPKAITRLYPGG